MVALATSATATQMLLELVFDDLALDLPGLLERSGLSELVPMRWATLRHGIEALNDPDLANCWTDDITIGTTRTRGARRQARRQRQGGARRDRQQGRLAGAEQPGPPLTVEIHSDENAK